MALIEPKTVRGDRHETRSSDIQVTRSREVVDDARNGRIVTLGCRMQTGFAHQEHLTRMFGRRFGTTPGRFRTADLP